MAGANFADEARKNPTTDPDKIASLQQLRGLQWQAFERNFTDWLKKNNQTESLIREKAEAIIHKSINAE